jgi:hypothetical protein
LPATSAQGRKFDVKEHIRGTTARRASYGPWFRAIRRSVLAADAVAAATVIPLAGAGTASADTHTGYVFTITCGTTVYTAVSPTNTAASLQVVDSTEVFVAVIPVVAAKGNAADHFPAGKIQYCGLVNLTTGHNIGQVPFLVKGAP